MLLRTINADGRSLCKINGVSVNVAALRDVGKLRVNIHGQHDNQALLDPDSHMSFIDAYGKLTVTCNGAPCTATDGKISVPLGNAGDVIIVITASADADVSYTLTSK